MDRKRVNPPEPIQCVMCIQIYILKMPTYHTIFYVSRVREMIKYPLNPIPFFWLPVHGKNPVGTVTITYDEHSHRVILHSQCSRAYIRRIQISQLYRENEILSSTTIFHHCFVNFSVNVHTKRMKLLT